MNENISSAGSITAEIFSLKGKIRNIEADYRYHGLSPLNEPGFVAPPDPQTKKQHSILSGELLALQILDAKIPGKIKINQMDEFGLFGLTRKFGEFKPEKVRQSLDTSYVDWLISATELAIKIYNQNSPETPVILEVVGKHLNVTEEFRDIKEKINQLLAPDVLSFSAQTPPPQRQ